MIRTVRYIPIRQLTAVAAPAALASSPPAGFFLPAQERVRGDVKLEQGLEMLSIFKKHEYEVSILDDFEFYEEREKAMQERKSYQHQQQLSNSAWPVPAALRDDRRNTATMSGEFIGQISEKFTHAVTLEERSNADPLTDNNSSLNTAVATKPRDL
ncbi:hypothetical protein BHM03_00029146 [Ensete ventricosum]|nr:hypothetical protein BHM03_00029146 [Ensete ventricosum]